MAANVWYRAYHGMISDDKWPLVARKSGQPVAVVIAVWCALLDCASQSEDRGSVEGFDAESMDALLGIDDGACEAVLMALSSGKSPRIVDGRLVNWDKRQPKREREDSNSTERSRKHRANKKAQGEGVDVDAGNGVPPDATPCNAMQHNVTPCNGQIREEETREDKEGERNSTVAGSAGVVDGPLSDFCRKVLRGWPNWGLDVTPLTRWEKEAAITAFNAFNRRIDERLVTLLEEFFQTKKKNASGREYPKPNKRQAVFERLHDWVENAEQYAKEWRKPLTARGWARRKEATTGGPDVVAAGDGEGATEEDFKRAKKDLGINH